MGLAPLGMGLRLQATKAGTSAPTPKAGWPSSHDIVTVAEEEVAKLGAGTGVRSANDLSAAGMGAPHPLLASPILRGLPPTAGPLLTASFRAATVPARWESRAAALTHIESLVQVWPVQRWDEVGGLHVFLGISGSGKTTLTLKLARQLAEAGHRVAVLAVTPTDPVPGRAYRWAAQMFGVTAACASGADDAARALHQFSRHDTILVDAPCPVAQPALADQLLQLSAFRDVRAALHWTLRLHLDEAQLQRELALASRFTVDFFALTQADLAPGPGALVWVQLQGIRVISLLNADADIQAPLTLGRDSLFNELVRASD